MTAGSVLAEGEEDLEELLGAKRVQPLYPLRGTDWSDATGEFKDFGIKF
jgi:hypothetical protein